MIKYNHLPSGSGARLAIGVAMLGLLVAGAALSSVAMATIRSAGL